MIEITVLLIGLFSITLYWKYRSKSYESTLIEREEAIKLGAEYIDQLIGIDVSTWKKFTSYWYDQKIVSRMHKLNLLDKWRELLFSWGLVEAWRIRYVYENNSIAININAKGEITFLNSTIRNSNIYKQIEDKISTSTDVISKLNRPKGNLWNKINEVGTGEITEELSSIKHFWYKITHDNLRMKMTVIVEDDNRITQISNDTEIKTNDIQSIVRKEYRESALNLGSFIVSLCAVIISIFVLINTEHLTSLSASLIVSIIIIFAILLTAKEDIESSVINAYDSRLTLKSIYTVSSLSAFMGVTAYGFLIFILSFTGFNLALINNDQLFNNITDQIMIGIGSGFIFLSLSTIVFYVMQKKGYLRISPELSSRSIFLSGYNYRQSISMSIQSSLLEETMYRLLGISLVIWMFNNSVLAILLTSILWAFLHQGNGFSPPIFRWAQLLIIGLALGFIFVEYGFIAALLAHFIYNFLTTSLPLLDYKLIKRKQRKKPAHKSINLNV